MLIWIVLSVLVFASLGGGQGAQPLPDEMVVVLKLDKGLAEKQSAPTFMDPFPYLEPTLHEVIHKIDRAAADERVKGFVLSLKSGDITITQVQELRAAIERFRSTGKFTKFYTTSFADYGQGLSLYYLAGAFDEIWMQPVGMLAITGLSLEMPYARGALDKLGIRPEFFQREEYKSAMENFTAASMSPAARENYTSILNDYADQMTGAIAKDRSLSRAVVKKHIDTGLMSGEEALAARLIDRLDYGDVLIEEMNIALTGEAQPDEPVFVPLAQYHAKPVKKSTGRVALVQAVGMIAPGGARDTKGAAADEIAGALYAATDDEEIDGILLRIDSPGGSPAASETIRRAVIKAREKGKKVVVSMATVAASGGYWIAAPADEIYASPATLTGSIGVVMGKFSAAGLWDQVGVNWERLSYGENADLWSINEPMDARAKRRMGDLIDQTYDQFLDRVAQGRGMDKTAARRVAKGRAWTGAQAMERGLVDALGGQRAALDRLAQLLGHQDQNDLQVIILPREKKPVEKLLELMGQQASIAQWLNEMRAQVGAWRGMRGVQAVEPLGLFQ